MDAEVNSGVRLNLNNDEVEKLIKILIHHSKLNISTPREQTLDEINDLSELFNKVNKLEKNLVCACKVLRSFIQRSDETFNDIAKMIDAERRSGENCFSLLNERISNIQHLMMNIAVIFEDMIRRISPNDGTIFEQLQTNNGGAFYVESNVVENRGTSKPTFNMEDNPNTEEPDIDNSSTSSDSTRVVSDNSLTYHDDNAIEEDYDENLHN
uniref:Biogenesis of lysosome-related organelles complex 1 subunit 4 n=1 Tax=Strongyloides venezuelensis TaxID=75913 RepID=A0A0K0F9M6_STRVS